VARKAFEVDWTVVVGAIWVTGAGVTLALTLVRLSRFNRLLREARCAGRWTRAMAQQVAGRMGIARCPAVALVPGAVSPMLWAMGSRARLLLPEALWGRLSAAQQSALLAHELAHYRRRDHWVRYLELVASVVYWWHPLVWLSRRELRVAEEACCDAWVVHALPGHARDYATALLDTVDFVSEFPCSIPFAASGAGGAKDLKRRLVMIMNAKSPRSMSFLGRAVVLGLGLVLLPALPRLATAAADEGDAPKAKEVRRDGEGDRPRAEGERGRDGEAPRPPGGEGDRRGNARPRGEPDRGDSAERLDGERALPVDAKATGSGTFVRIERGTMLLSDDENDKDVRVAIKDETRVVVDGQPSNLRELRPGMVVTASEKEGATVVEAKRPRWLKTLMPAARGERTDDRQVDEARRRADDERRRADDFRRRAEEAGRRAREVRPDRPDPNNPNLTIEERMRLRREQANPKPDRADPDNPNLTIEERMQLRREQENAKPPTPGVDGRRP
jgi:beta-lactamase regulating signal transducer with metallopeptidase domain